MKRVLRIALVCLLGAATAFVVACGDRSKLIPDTAADALLSNFEAVDAGVSGEDCRAA